MSVEERVWKIVCETDEPVSVDYVRYHARTTWAIAKASLLELLIKKMISGRKTTKSWIFWAKSAQRQRRGLSD